MTNQKETLYLKGWLEKSENGYWDGINWTISKTSIIEKILSKFMNFSNEYDIDYTGYACLGEEVIVPDVSLYIYATKEESTFEEAWISLLNKLEGDCYTDIQYNGFSEYTILGLNLKTFTIGGHDLNKELERYIGNYVHFVMEVKENRQ